MIASGGGGGATQSRSVGWLWSDDQQTLNFAKAKTGLWTTLPGNKGAQV